MSESPLLVPTFSILCGDALTQLRTLPSESIHCCITSPPFYALRDYGVSGQIGLEATPDAYVAKLVEVFREVRRVLKTNGTLWLNLGDSYVSAPTGSLSTKPSLMTGGRKTQEEASKRPNKSGIGLKTKDLIGIPWLVAFALRDDGWYLRSDIIYSKPNPMPESVRDRPTKAHEYLFLLTKSQKYYYDADAIKEPATMKPQRRNVRLPYDAPGAGAHRKGTEYLRQTVGQDTPDGFRNKRSVWSIPTKPYKGAHFATMPPALVEPCVLAGCPPAGKRCDCADVIFTPTGSVESIDPSITTGRAGMNRERGSNEGTRPITKHQQRWYAIQLRTSSHKDAMKAEAGPAFAHYIRTDKSGARPIPPDLLEAWLTRGWLQPATAECNCPEELAGTVLDPFSGSGTTGIVALKHGRSYIGIELNPEYVKLSHERYENSREQPKACLDIFY